METLRIGLVGTGGIGRTHIERINNTLQGGKVVACADPASAFGFSVAEKYGIKGFETPIDMINSPEIDAVMCTTSDPYHEEYVLASIAAGKVRVLREAARAQGGRLQTHRGGREEGREEAGSGRLHAPLRRGIQAAQGGG